MTRDGLKTNPRLIEAVSEFPTPRSVQEVRRFLGLSSYYRRFIRNFAKIHVAAPLHQLTRKETQFWWSTDCASAFNQLKMNLTSAPILAYPSFDQQFVLETDASVQGLGTVLSQKRTDDKTAFSCICKPGFEPTREELWYNRFGDPRGSLGNVAFQALPLREGCHCIH